jgi:hypothetical protein
MITKNTKPISPLRNNRNPKLPEKSFDKLWDLYTDNEKVFVLNYLNRLSLEDGDTFTINTDSIFNKNEIDYIINVLHGKIEYPRKS